MTIVYANFAPCLREMLDRGWGNEWSMHEEMLVYFRVGKKLIDDQLTQCVQIANLGTEARFQGKGIFTRLLAEIEEITDLPIYIEHILNREFFDALLRRGFRPPNGETGKIWSLVRTWEENKT